MARLTLAPGFRFKPTDEILVVYYLKRKILGKKIASNAVAEVNIYDFCPWDLPGNCIS
ncbi:putative transcription factor NAM family [Helianthus annuus]|nr:putative transcription factor NAM family [Helianthus annuus]KAJ0805580.1 putative transcription factor NAM family [Helianthus annuus]